MFLFCYLLEETGSLEAELTCNKHSWNLISSYSLPYFNFHLKFQIFSKDFTTFIKLCVVLPITGSYRTS